MVAGWPFGEVVVLLESLAFKGKRRRVALRQRHTYLWASRWGTTPRSGGENCCFAESPDLLPCCPSLIDANRMTGPAYSTIKWRIWKYGRCERLRACAIGSALPSVLRRGVMLLAGRPVGRCWGKGHTQAPLERLHWVPALG